MKYMIMMFGTAGEMMETRSSEWITEMIGFMTGLDRRADRGRRAGVQRGPAGRRHGQDGPAGRRRARSPTDGPYAEIKESLAGFWVLDVDRRGRILEIVGRIVPYSGWWRCARSAIAPDVRMTSGRPRTCCASSRRRSSACSSAGTGSSTPARTPCRRRCSPPPCSGRPPACRTTRGPGCSPSPPAGWSTTGAATAPGRRREEAVGHAGRSSPGRPSDRDDTLTLLFLCCHPALSPPSQLALTLRAVGGLTTAEIAAAFLVPEPTMAQRISRAKTVVRAAGARFELPPPAERAGPAAASCCTCST